MVIVKDFPMIVWYAFVSTLDIVVAQDYVSEDVLELIVL